MFQHKYLKLFIFISFYIVQITTQSGPDPWNYEVSKPPESADDQIIPPDLRMPIKRKSKENKLGTGEWFFRRMLTIVLKGGNTKKNEDGTVDISLQMKFYPKQWETLDDTMKSDSSLSEDMLRRSVGYVEDSIYKPSITEQIVLTWSEYGHVYLTKYKTYITWTLCCLAVIGCALWLWRHMSHKHTIVLLLLIFYAYEVVISYKEAEQKELEKFLSAVNQCKWFFWTSSCEVPPPDPLVFMKHMNPLKIGIRMFTTALAEPIVIFSGTVETVLNGVTAGLWYPFDKILYGILVMFVNISLIFLLVIILFNWLLNIPFGLKLFGIGVSVKSKKSAPVFQNLTETQPRSCIERDSISQATLDKILNVCSLALSSNTPTHQSRAPAIANVPKIHRSASTGRLPNNSSFTKNECLSLGNTIRRRNIEPRGGSGDS